LGLARRSPGGSGYRFGVFRRCPEEYQAAGLPYREDCVFAFQTWKDIDYGFNDHLGTSFSAIPPFQKQYLAIIYTTIVVLSSCQASLLWLFWKIVVQKNPIIRISHDSY